MFKLYQIINKEKLEVLPINEIYNVKELGDYEFSYQSNYSIDRNNLVIFLEDIEIEKKWYSYSGNRIYSTNTNKLFQDYFGFASLNINGEAFKLNILIEKFNISEIEEILIFLWKCENRLFENFFSKSSIKSKITNNGYKYEYTSKFLSFAISFYDFFNKLYPKFYNSPYSVLRKNIEIVDYSPKDVSAHSINWILNNFDSVNFDEKLIGHPDSIIIDNKYGYIDRIETDKSSESFYTYENEIILGAFSKLLSKLKHLKRIINSNIDTNNYGEGDYADFRDLKKIPFLKLFKDANSIENKIGVLFNRYKNIFKNVRPRIEKPRITSVFLHNNHYREAFRKIQETYDYKFNLDGELSLLNIKKLSTLYEFYNLHQIIHCFKSKLNIDLFDIREQSNRVDDFINYISFVNNRVSIEIFYNYSYPNYLSNLIRIDNTKGTTYNPDYIIQFKVDNKEFTIILDAKYSKIETVKTRYLPECMFKYILNTGKKHNRYAKVDYLVLLYSGEIEESIVQNPDFSPQIIIIPSKPNFEYYLEKYISDIIENELPYNFYKKESTILES